ncbi:MAG TPA: metal ABC transporter ATP-binding protein [Acholeplasmataceae bacterium]|nr:metal ABC transporter ATP-binding protein [Acholeplasmataceae bacterium]
MHIKVKDLSFSYTQRLVLNKVTVDLKEGSFLALIGKNGTGKSTFIKCLLKIEPVPDNTIFYDGVDINTIKNFKNVGYVPQKLEFNYEFPITVNEILSSSYLKGKDLFYTSIINELNLNQIYRQNVNTLSGGQLQRVFIARSLLNHPRLLILDEPTVGIDKESMETLKNILSDLKKKGVTIIMSTHDTSFIKDLADYYLEFSELGDYNLIEATEV